MKDTELRGILLQKYYEHRRGRYFLPKPEEFDVPISEIDIIAVSSQLGEHGLLDWKELKTLNSIWGNGKISAFGIDVVEGAAKPDIKVEFVQNKTVTISGSSNVIVGDHNQQNISHHVTALEKAIDASSATPEAKQEAKGILRRFAEHPLVTSLAGGAISLLGN
jgi:hypothetical protein